MEKCVSFPKNIRFFVVSYQILTKKSYTSLAFNLYLSTTKIERYTWLNANIYNQLTDALTLPPSPSVFRQCLSARFCKLLALNSGKIDKLNFIVVTALLSLGEAEGGGGTKVYIGPSRSLNLHETTREQHA